jgi:hypothetical protein
MKIPKWKQRRIKARAELEIAERRARHAAFWAAVPPPRVRRPVDFAKLGVIE